MSDKEKLIKINKLINNFTEHYICCFDKPLFKLIKEIRKTINDVEYPVHKVKENGDNV